MNCLEKSNEIEDYIFKILTDYIENEKDADTDDEFYQEGLKNYNLIKNDIPKLKQQIDDIWEYELKVEIKQEPFHFAIIAADNKDVKLAKKKLWAKQIELELIKENILIWVVKNRILF